MGIKINLSSVSMLSACILIPSAFVYMIRDLEAYEAFYQGLNFKVEEIADKNNDGALNIEEMVSVFNTINIDPEKRLNNLGFFLTNQEKQQYLKATGNYDPSTDSTYSLFGGDHPYYIKAVAEGKPVSNLNL